MENKKSDEIVVTEDKRLDAIREISDKFGPPVRVQNCLLVPLSEDSYEDLVSLVLIPEQGHLHHPDPGAYLLSRYEALQLASDIQEAVSPTVDEKNRELLRRIEKLVENQS